MAYLKSPAFDEKDFPGFEQVKREFGFLPSFYTAQVARPDLVNAEMNLVEAVLFHTGALPRKQVEYIFLVCSAANLSTYCVTAHCEIVRLLKIDGPEPEQIAVDYQHSKISIADKALLNFCSKLNRDGTKFERSDVEKLRTFGFSDQQIMEACVVVGLAQFANTVAFGLGTLPDFRNAAIEAALGYKEEPISNSQQVVEANSD